MATRPTARVVRIEHRAGRHRRHDQRFGIFAIGHDPHAQFAQRLRHDVGVLARVHQHRAAEGRTRILGLQRRTRRGEPGEPIPDRRRHGRTGLRAQRLPQVQPPAGMPRQRVFLAGDRVIAPSCLAQTLVQFDIGGVALHHPGVVAHQALEDQVHVPVARVLGVRHAEPRLKCHAIPRQQQTGREVIFLNVIAKGRVVHPHAFDRAAPQRNPAPDEDLGQPAALAHRALALAPRQSDVGADRADVVAQPAQGLKKRQIGRV
jgi:hypothetical protein